MKHISHLRSKLLQTSHPERTLQETEDSLEVEENDVDEVEEQQIEDDIAALNAAMSTSHSAANDSGDSDYESDFDDDDENAKRIEIFSAMY